MHHRLMGSALVALSLYSAAPAFAEEPGQDEVTLKNGGTVRGTIVTAEPGTSVKVIELGQQQTRVIPWSQVSDIERGKFAPKATVQPGPAGPGYAGASSPAVLQSVPAPEPASGAPGVVKLHVDSPVPVTVMEDAGRSVGAVGGHAFVIQRLRTVCAGTCDRVVDGSQGQMFAATGDFPAKPFSLAGYQGDVSLRVQPGSNGRRVGGIMLTSVGGGGLVAGVVMLSLSLSLGSAGASASDPYPTQSTGSGMKSASIGVLVGGAVGLASGIALLATSSTTIKLEPRAARRGAAVAQRRPRYWAGEF